MNGAIALEDRHAQLYQSIGELVMATQWVESRYRELGWFIQDPERSTWPPRTLRKESLAQLIDAVTEMFLELIRTSTFPNGGEFAKIASAVHDSLHQLRNYRNQVLHSAFVELKAGGEVVGNLRTDAKRGVDPDTGELIGKLEDISAEAVRAALATFGDACFHLNMMYLQAIQWYGLDNGAKWRGRRSAT
jgi:hypothetical protein